MTIRMDQDEKRKLIVAEIEHWRGSRLLPEQYCDFLLNLYMDDQEERPVKWFGVSQAAVRNSSWKTWFTIIGIIGLISFVVFHFTSFPFGMQTAVSAVSVSLFYMLGAVKREKAPVLSYLCFGTGSMLLLVLGVYLMGLKDMGGMAVALFAGLCSLVWMLTGIMARIGILHFSGWMVLFLIYAYVLRQNISDLDWIGLELCWVPVSLVLVWLGWLFHHVNKPVAAVLLSSGVIAWLGAEAYGLAVTEVDPGMMQLFLFVKLILAGSVLFGFRKKWIEWVA